MTSGPVNSDGQQTQERLLSVKEELSKSAFWNTRSIQELIGKHDASANKQANLRLGSKSGRSPRSPIDVESTADEHSQDPGSSAIKKSRSATKRPRKDSVDVSISELRNKSASAHINNAGQQTQESLLSVKDALCQGTRDCQKVSRLVRIGSTMKLYKRLAIGKRSKELSSPHSSLDVDSTFQHTGKENSMMSINSCTQQDLSLDATYEEHPVKGIYERDILFDEELTNDMCQVNRNGSVSTDHAAIQVAKCNQLMDALLSLDRPTQQGRENYENAGSSQLTVDGSSQSTLDNNSNLRRCSTPSPFTAPISGHPVPFVKNLHAWPAVEASDVFKLVPQQPHFLPLREHPLEIREGMASGVMVSFVSLVENIRKASIEESMDFFENKINTLCHFERYGFNVEFLQSSLTKMLQIKSNRSKYLEEINKLKEEMVEKTTSLPRMNASLNQKQKIISELEQQLAHLCLEAQQIKKDREHENAKLSRLESMRSRFEEACGEGESQFRNILDDLRRERQWSLEDVPLPAPDDVIRFLDSEGGLDYSGGPYSPLAAPTENTTTGSSPIDCTTMAGNGYSSDYSRAPPAAGTAIAAAPSISEAMVGIPGHGDENRAVAEPAEANNIGVGDQQAPSKAGDDVQPMIVQEYFPAAPGPSQPNNANEEQEQQEVRPTVRSKYQIQRERISKLSPCDILPYLHLPMEVACQKLQVSATVFKNLKKKSGIKRWPYRKIKKIDTQIAKLRERGNGGAAVMDKIQELIDLKKNIIIGASDSRNPPVLDSEGGLDYSGGPYSLPAAPTDNTTTGSSPMDCIMRAGNGCSSDYSKAPPAAGTAIAAAPSINEAMVGIPSHGDENHSVAEPAEADNIGVGDQQASSSAGDDVQPMIVEEYFTAAPGWIIHTHSICSAF